MWPAAANPGRLRFISMYLPWFSAGSPRRLATTNPSETRGRIPLCGPICWALVPGSDAREDTIYSLHDQRIPRSVRSSIKVGP